jgi:hypothetical protein
MLSSVQQEVFTHRHDRHQTSVNEAVARVVEVGWLMKRNNRNNINNQDTGYVCYMGQSWVLHRAGPYYISTLLTDV